MVEKIILKALESAQKYCRSLNLEYHPILIDKPLNFITVINQFIQQRGIRDLTSSQFNGQLNECNPKDFVEMCGILTYSEKNGLYEVSYTHPNQSKVIMSGGKWIRTETNHMLIDPFDIPRDAEVLIDYHSHPSLTCELSPRDVLAMGRFRSLIEMVREYETQLKSYYFGIFSLQNNNVVWYTTEPQIF